MIEERLRDLEERVEQIREERRHQRRQIDRLEETLSDIKTDITKMRGFVAGMVCAFTLVASAVTFVWKEFLK